MNYDDLRNRLGLTVLETAPCQVAVIDRQRRIVLSNSAFGRLFAVRDGAACFEVYKRRGAPCDKCIADLSFADGSEHISDEEGIDRDGGMVRYRLQAVPLADSSGKTKHVALISTDITHVEELERGLKQAERLATAGLTAAGLAHTIKNILAGLEGGTYVVESGLKQSDQARVGMGWEMVQGYIDQVSSLVRNLLTYSKPQEPHREVVTPRQLVEDVVRLYDDKASLANVTLESHVDSDLPLLSLDREGMHASLTNLLANALDACMWDPDTDKKHRIVVAARALAGGGVAFEVSDNGMGISEENQRKVLRGHFTTKGIRGTGLGLLLTKKAVQEHEGTIHFASTPGVGTRFRMEFPSPGLQHPGSSGLGEEKQ